MKTINEDPAHFFEEGGWNFLQPGTDVSIRCFLKSVVCFYQTLFGNSGRWL
jgi:hypothetical protein